MVCAVMANLGRESSGVRTSLRAASQIVTSSRPSSVISATIGALSLKPMLGAMSARRHAPTCARKSATSKSEREVPANGRKGWRPSRKLGWSAAQQRSSSRNPR